MAESRVVVSSVSRDVDELTGRLIALAGELRDLGELGLLAGQADPLCWPAAAGDPDDVDHARISRVHALEVVKAAACAAQARITAAFAESQHARQLQAGVPVERANRGIPSQVGLARQESPHKGQYLTGLATVLVREMPCTLAALARGELNEWRATIIVRETAELSLHHRATADRELCGPGADLTGVGDAAIARSARTISQRLDPGAAWRRAQKAVKQRRVTTRPEPDCMLRLTAFLPVAQGVAVYAALCQAADRRIATGDVFSLQDDDEPLSRSQLMADELVTRILGGPATGAAAVPEPAAEIQLIMTDRALFGLDDEPAHLTGYGPIPAPLARRIAAGGAGATPAKRWIRRLYTRPGTGQLVAMDSHRRQFPDGIARFVVARDQFCRTPWCDARIRHIDHIDEADRGGPTSAANAQGLCEACNHAKQARGWSQTAGRTGSITTTTPSGHHYRSRPPEPPGQRRQTPGRAAPSPLEQWGAAYAAA